MMKYAFRHFSRRPLTNFLLILQMLVIHVIAAALVSSAASRYEEYAPFRRTLKGDGYYYNMVTCSDPETGAVYTREALAEKLRGNVSITRISNIGNAAYPCDGEWTSEVFTTVQLDDEILNDYPFTLMEGEQIDLKKDYGELVPVIVSENKLGYGLGTQIPYKQGDDIMRTAVVVGILKDFARVPIAVSTSDSDLSVHQFYTNYSTAVEGKPVLIAPESLFTYQPYSCVFNGMIFIQYPDGISEEDKAANHEFMLRYGNGLALQSMDFPTLRRNSWRYIFAQCLTLLPVVTAVLILCITSILSMSALAAKRQIRDYAVYALCGLPWKFCIKIHAFEMLISAFAAYLLTWVGMILCRPLYEDTVLRIGLPQIITGLFVMAFCMLTARILPRQLFRRSSLKTVLQDNE